MREAKLAEHLEFLASAREEDEATVLAAALRAGVETLYREALIDGFLGERIPREQVLREIGAEPLAEIERQRDVLRRDVEWASREREAISDKLDLLFISTSSSPRRAHRSKLLVTTDLTNRRSITMISF